MTYIYQNFFFPTSICRPKILYGRNTEEVTNPLKSYDVNVFSSKAADIEDCLLMSPAGNMGVSSKEVISIVPCSADIWWEQPY